MTGLCLGNEPATRHYAGSKVIRNHLIKCFESGQIVPFLSTPVIKKPAMIKELNIYCQCCLPLASEHLKHPGKDEPTCMVQCYICENLYHYSCVNMTLQAAEKLSSVSTKGVKRLLVIFLTQTNYTAYFVHYDFSYTVVTCFSLYIADILGLLSKCCF